MPKIDFYILTENDPDARFAFVCRLVEKAYKNNHRIYIHAADETTAHQMDEWLWTYRNDSFLPHNLLGDGPEPPPPIQIGFHEDPKKHRDVLINLSDQLPDFYPRFSRVIEVVLNNETHQALARDLYRQYRTAGFEITTHKMQTVE